jgi:hypothetical protein
MDNNDIYIAIAIDINWLSLESHFVDGRTTATLLHSSLIFDKVVKTSYLITVVSPIPIHVLTVLPSFHLSEAIHRFQRESRKQTVVKEAKMLAQSLSQGR